jgi:hypothetical protein
MSADTFRRNATAVGLVTTAALSLVSVALQPEFPAEADQRLAAIDAAGGQGVVSAAAFVLAQLPFIVAVLGVAHLLRGRADWSSTVGACLGVAGAFGHAVFGGIALVYLSMAADVENRGVHAALMERVEGSPAMVFTAMGLLGTVLGLSLLGVSLWRSGLVARWIPVGLWLFIVVEFAAAGLSEYASAVSVVLYLVVMVALAAWVVRTPAASWAPPATASHTDLVVTS